MAPPSSATAFFASAKKPGKKLHDTRFSFGDLTLFFSKKKRGERQINVIHHCFPMAEITILLIVLAVCLFLAVILVELALPKKKKNAGESLEQRVERLERAIASSNSYLLSQKLGHRLSKLDNFRLNAEVEIKALKEKLDNGKGKRNKLKGKELSTEEMRRLIYRSK